MRVLVLTLAALTAALGGCTRSFYRRWADRETAGLVRERNRDPRWHVPLGVYPPSGSRLFDPFNPDRPPMPPDDPAAHRYMHCADGIPGYRRWHKDGDAPWIEDPSWRGFLDLTEDGVLKLTPDRAVGVGLLNSREYQTQRENLYLSALALTLNLFEFDTQWFLRNGTNWTHFGSGATELNTLTTASEFGFNKNFAAGGQLLVDFANTFVFEFAGPDRATTLSTITFNLIQPLLRNAGRNFRLEALTEAERTLLYQLRTYARFRKVYTFNVATQGYLQLLSQEQQIRNQQANLASVEQNLRLHEALYTSGIVSSVKVDQVFQSVQQAQLGLIQAEASLQTQQDIYKELLGVPPTMPLKLDDSVLAPFQLNDPALTGYQEELDRFLAVYRELDEPPPLVKLEEGYRQLKEFEQRFPGLIDMVAGEIERWRKKLAKAGGETGQADRDRAALDGRTRDLEEVRAELEFLTGRTNRDAGALAEGQRKQNWEALQDRTNDLVALAAQLFVVQTQARVFLIELNPVPYEEGPAIEYALGNRLDLMNQRAQVTDAWRQISVTANALEAGLDVIVNGNIATKPGGINPVDFRSGASSYTVGFRFDGPLNRLAQRNAYRASLIAYQQARRSFMLLEDQIERTIRLDLRNLRTARLNFEIARQSLIIAARQLESAREELLQQGANADPTSTQNILNALNDVLRAKNTLIDSWVSYETGRYQLLLDMEALQVTEQGTYADERDDTRGGGAVLLDPVFDGSAGPGGSGPP
jgi:outer membrane protein TolC